MSKTISLRLAMPVLIAALMPITASGQSQDSQTQSVAEAARKAREQKKASAKPVPVITEDNLKPPTPAEKAVEAAADAQAAAANPAAPADAAKPGPKSDTAQNTQKADDEAKKKKAKAELDGLKEQLAAVKKSLDLLQRELALDQDTFLSNPYHDRDTAGQAKLDGIKQQISDKQQEVDVLKTRIAALVELLGTDATTTPATSPSTPQP